MTKITDKELVDLIMQHKDLYGFYQCKLTDGVQCKYKEAPAYDQICVRYLGIICNFYKGINWEKDEERNILNLRDNDE